MTPDSLSYFVSYKRGRDEDFAMRLAKDLRSAGVRVWMDRLDIVAGQNWDEAVEAALHFSRGLIVILSPESVASKNVMDEVSYALDEDKQVVPALLRACSYPFRLRRPQHADFTGSYERGLEELLRAVKVGPASAPPQGADKEAAPDDRSIADEAQPGILHIQIRRRSWLIGLLFGVGLALVWLSLFLQYDTNKFDPGLWALFLCIDAIAGAIAGRISGQVRLPIQFAAGLAFAAFIVGLASFVFSDQSGGIGYLIGGVAWSVGIPLGAILGALRGRALVRRKAGQLADHELPD